MPTSNRGCQSYSQWNCWCLLPCCSLLQIRICLCNYKMQLSFRCQLLSQLFGCAATAVRQLPPLTTPLRWHLGHTGLPHQHWEGAAWLSQPSNAFSPAIPAHIQENCSATTPGWGGHVQLGGSSYLVTMPLGDWGALHWKEAFLEVTVRICGGGCSEGGAGCVVIWAMGPLLQQLKQVQASTPMEYVVKGFSPCIVCWVAVPSDSYKN